MAMRNDTRAELRMLRQIAWHYLEGQICPFCKNALVPDWDIPYGHGDAPEMIFDLCVHHVDNDPDNNDQINRQVAHRSCHKAYTMSAQRRAGVTT